VLVTMCHGWFLDWNKINRNRRQVVMLNTKSRRQVALNTSLNDAGDYVEYTAILMCSTRQLICVRGCYIYTILLIALNPNKLN
jgi:hypothetical protein